MGLLNLFVDSKSHESERQHIWSRSLMPQAEPPAGLESGSDSHMVHETIYS